MSSKIKLNKNTLREQTQALKLYQEFLPTLELRKQQLQAEVRTVEGRIRKRKAELEETLADAAGYAPMLTGVADEVRELVVVDEVVSRIGNVAGVRVPVFEAVRFEAVPYSLLGSTPFLDAAIRLWRDVESARAELDLLEQQREALQVQLTKTTQRINLYEKVLIPECRENIKRIKVYLGDQQTAAVCRAKMAKAKITRTAEAESLALRAAARAAPQAGG